MTVYGFIGAGNMAGAIVRGAVAAGLTRGADPATVLVTSAHDSAAALAAQLADPRVEALEEAPALVRRSDVLVLGVKPHVVPQVLAALREPLASSRPLVVSLAAGLSLDRLASLLPQDARVVRAMPNMAAAVGQSMTALTAGPQATDDDLAAVTALLGAVGRTVVLPERLLAAFTAIAGCSPAFVFTFIEALARGGVEAGLPKAQAVEIATQAVLGSALSIQAEAARAAAGLPARTPADLVDAVCSPGGTTVAGLVALERAGFSPAVVAGVQATIDRDRELGA